MQIFINILESGAVKATAVECSQSSPRLKETETSHLFEPSWILAVGHLGLWPSLY